MTHERLARTFARTFAQHASATMLAGALACALLPPASARAEGGPGAEPLRIAPAAPLPPHARLRPCCRRPLPPEIAYRDPRGLPPPPPALHAPGPVVRAYLPRNDALPMYNEPPARFPMR